MNQRRPTNLLCVAVLFAGGAGAAQAQALPAPSSGWVAAGSAGVFRSGDPGRKPPVYLLTAGWELPFSERFILRGTVSRLKAVNPDRHMSCVALPPPGSGCRPDPEFPARMWAVEGTMVVTPLPVTMLGLLLGAGVGLPRGNLEKLPTQAEGAAALWRVGIEAGPPGRPGMRVQLAQTWFGREVLSASSYMIVTLLLRSR